MILAHGSLVGISIEPHKIMHVISIYLSTFQLTGAGAILIRAIKYIATHVVDPI
jgi:hypothetical protein